MKTLTLQISDDLESKLKSYARIKGISQSEIIHRALADYISQEEFIKTGTIFELSKDLAGSVEGPSDLSCNPHYLEDYGQ